MTFSTMLQGCSSDDACNFMYHCENGACRHDQIFPLQLYPIFVYLVIPIASGLCNLSGNSMGMFKVMIMMNLLRYNVGDATAIVQALVIGAALPNFIEIIREKHPNGKTSLVNFNLLLIFIPCCLYGSTIGALLQSILPELIQDILVFIMFGYFTFNFFKKVREQSSSKQQMRQSLISSIVTQQSIIVKDEITTPQQSTESSERVQQQQQQQQNKQEQNKVKNLPTQQNIPQAQKDSELIQLGEKIRKYQQSIHLKDILKTLFIFLGFEALSFLAQGQFPSLHFTKCTVFYPSGLVVLTLTTGIFMLYVKKQMALRFKQYKLVNFEVQIDLGDKKTFWKLVLGALGAGFVQGTLGVGAGTFLMAVLFTTSINPRVASATSGYQILFTGSAALTQQFVNNKITMQQAGFFFIWTAIAGGIVTYIIYRMIKRADENKVKKILLWIITMLSVTSLVLLLPVTIQRLVEQGWDYMMQYNFQC